MRKGRRGCIGHGGEERGWSLEALLEELEECFGELEPTEEGFDIFVCGG